MKGSLTLMSKVFLFVEVNIKPGQFNEFVAKLKGHIEIIRTEAGCEFIDIYSDTNKTDIVNVWAKTVKPGSRLRRITYLVNPLQL
jgi:hypothetical protein